jgi:hypothetical protein
MLLAAVVATPRPSYALGRDVRAVMTTSLYGIAAGTVLGLGSYAFNHEPRSIAIGSSVGLYLGIIAGIYYINHRDDAGNPLRSDADELRRLAASAPPRAPTPADPRPADFEARFVLKRF